MKPITRIGLAVLLGVFTLSVAPNSTADDWNRLTTAVFTQPVEIPGVVLQPGIYVFKIPDVTGNHGIVQVWNLDQRVLYATVLCWIEYVPDPPSENLFIFEERAEGTPVALKSWFRRGNPNGEMFIYPRRSAK